MLNWLVGHASRNSCNDYACNLSRQYRLFVKAYDTDAMHLLTVIKRWWVVMFSLRYSRYICDIVTERMSVVPTISEMKCPIRSNHDNPCCFAIGSLVCVHTDYTGELYAIVRETFRKWNKTQKTQILIDRFS